MLADGDALIEAEGDTLGLIDADGLADGLALSDADPGKRSTTSSTA